MNKIDLYPAQRKTCRALATISKGNGKVRINNIPAEILEPKLAKEMVLTPLNILGEIRNRVDINVKVQGGGFMGQAFASAVAISRALTGEGKGGRDPKDHPLTKSMREEVRRKIMEFDRHLLSGDPRQTESKKFGGPGARRRKQKSYR
ncbi:MAG: rpsI [Nitrososphaeraceae archaeon]|jgi:small subunit ribosomal protein S9|nr:rpsI [Nitrososphaeraceae archaeon]MDQ3939580.1 30S ribosomal protein S9 [Thermoproteota archaeon]HEV2877134.1 30S ribosomal protein S9 [Nitrososphaeraceae archaeon]HYZ94732.1 30S ribosomal protein S9 [Nitrososphaeraceae archaeon]